MKDIDRYRPRDLRGLLRRALDSFPVVVVTGMRQTGKSTLLRNELADRRYLTLDDFGLLEAARGEPEALLGSGEPVVIDEAQKCPELLTAVKRAVDDRRQNGRFVLSGSANFALLRDVSESLAGRALYLRLWPMTRREILGRVEEPPFLARFARELVCDMDSLCEPVQPEEIMTGGMPPVALGQSSGELWFRAYQQTYLERDLRDLSQVADLGAFRLLMNLAAARTGQVLNVSELGRDAKINATTTGRYLSLLETSFVYWKLLPSLRSRSSRLIKAPKLYCADAGLCCWLAGVDDLEPAGREPLRGSMLETWVAQNLAAIVEAYLPRARLGFWHVQGRHEVDFVIETGKAAVAIEVKSGSRWSDSDLRGLHAFASSRPDCRAAVLAHNGRTAARLGEKLWAIPLGTLLS